MAIFLLKHLKTVTFKLTDSSGLMQIANVFTAQFHFLGEQNSKWCQRIKLS